MPRPLSVLLIGSPAARPENEAALAWLRSLPEVVPEVAAIESLPAEIGDGSSILWFHLADPPDPDADVRAALDRHVRAGGGLLATLAAVVLPHQLGWERAPPNEVTTGEWSDEPEDLAFADFSVLPRVRGLQSFRGHPLFDGLGGGCYTWDPEAGEPFVRYAYTGDVWPAAARVVAVQRSYIAMNEGRRLAWEYMMGDGWALCIGGFVHFTARKTSHRPHLERLLRNALHRIRPDGRAARLLGGAWSQVTTGVEESRGASLPPPLPDELGSAGAAGDIRLRRAASDERYTLAGARALLVGRERGGPEEVWFHPVRAVSRWELRYAGGGQLTADEYEITPGHCQRRLVANGRTIIERTAVAPDEAALLMELRAEDGRNGGGGGVVLDWSMETDLRLMWPYPAAASGRLRYQVGDGGIGVVSDAGEWMGLRMQPAAALEVEDISDVEHSRIRVRTRVGLDGPVRILVVGAGRAERAPLSVNPAGWAERRGWERASQREGGSLPHVADAELAAAMEWARWRLSTYRVTVPGLGSSLVAGYNRSRSGTFGDGRPGYAWFFGRDAVWTGLACLAVGQHRNVREVLGFLGRRQDITGKILHECTTSGVVHYDAADSTPLYLLLAARYLAASGDEATLRREWPRIVKAYDYCLSTDSDGDALIENSGVGHGWVEFGPLGGNHVSLYLAGVWVAALDELEVAARRIGDPRLADELSYEGAAARSALELAFFDPVEGRYATGLRADGSRNMAESAITAVPLLLGAVRPERCAGWLDRVASSAFTTPWGVRIVPSDHPDYDPAGYHTGAVWPLFTGWVAMAEARAGRVESARRHWEQVARLYSKHTLGAFPEVLHGESGECIGVTPDQAWSAAMALLPSLSLSRAHP